MLFCLALAGVLFVAQTYLAALLEPMIVGGAGRGSGEAGVGVLRRGGLGGRRLAARPGGRQQGDRRGVRGAGGAGGGRAAAVRDGPGPAAAAGLSQVDAVRGAAGRAAVRGGRDAGGGGVGGPARRRAGPSGVGRERRGADRVRAAARVGGRLVRRAAAWRGRRAGGGSGGAGAGRGGAGRGDRGGVGERRRWWARSGWRWGWWCSRCSTGARGEPAGAASRRADRYAPARGPVRAVRPGVRPSADGPLRCQ